MDAYKISRQSCQKFECIIVQNKDYLFKCLESSNDGQILVAKSDSKSIYNLPDEIFVKNQANPVGEDEIISPNMKVLVSTKEKHLGKIKLFNLPDKKHFKRLNGYSSVTSLVISPDSSILASSYEYFTSTIYSGTIRLWSLPSGKLLNIMKTDSKSYIRKLLISPDNNILVSQDGAYFHTWSLPDGNPLQKSYYSHSSHNSTSFIISPNSRMLICGYDDGTISLRNLLDGELLINLIEHKSSINSLAISTDSSILASGGVDDTICLWSLPDGEHLATLKGHTDSIASLAISSDKRTLASGSLDGTIRIWSSSINTPISKFTPKDIAEIERKGKDSSLEEGTRNAFKFTLALIRLRQQFDIDIEDSSSNIASSEFDIEIE